MAEIADIVVDCARPAPLARFWADVLDGYRVAPYDEEELARLRAKGIDDPEDDPTVLVEGPPGRPRLFFVTVPEPKTVKNRLHWDVTLTGPTPEALEAAGATVLRAPDDDVTWWVMADPEGNEFCAFPPAKS